MKLRELQSYSRPAERTSRRLCLSGKTLRSRLRRTRRPYSCIGICCSISRHALIFSLRHTQHSGSPAARTVVCAPHTEHFSTFLRRSGETDFFACSSRSAGTTGSGFGWILRFIEPQCKFHYDRKQLGGQPNLWCPRTMPLPESVLPPPLPGKTRSEGTSGRLQPWHISPSGRSARLRCECKSGNAPNRGCGFRVKFSFSTPLQLIGRR